MYQYRDLRSCSCLHSTSEAEARQFRRLGLQQPIVLLPNGVELPDDKSGKFPHEDSDDAGNSVRREVLFLSRIHPVKGLPNLIKAWKIVANPDWALKIVGSDEEGDKKEILGLIKDLNLQDTIIVEDAVYGDQKWALLKKADVVVLPSYSENFGIVVAESLSVGTPIITTTGTPWERVVSEGCGWFVAPTIEGMAIGLGSAMRQSQTQLSQMGNLGRAWVQKEFGWRDIGNKMIAAYQFLLGRDQTCSWIEHSPEGRRAA